MTFGLLDGGKDEEHNVVAFDPKATRFSFHTFHEAVLMLDYLTATGL